MRRAIAALPPTLSDELERIWESALASRWTLPPVWTHGDFAPRNLLLDEAGNLAGVIDFGQVCAGDPACDLVIAWVYLEGSARAAFREAIDLDPETWARARGWAAWKAAILASGVAKGPRPDIAAAETVLRTLIEDRTDPR
jgi:aminoglycoside phosphotransferase (APT) family kinase protein